MNNSNKKDNFHFKFWGYEENIDQKPGLMKIRDKVYEGYKKLVDRGVDFSKNDYVKEADFQHLCQEYIEGTRISIGWLVELAVVPQKRLAEIYGIYAMGINVDIDIDKLTDEAFENYINLNSGNPDDDTNQGNYVYKRTSNKVYNHDKMKKKIKDWLHIDPEKLKDLKSRYKFYSLMYDVGESKGVNLSILFNKPSLENMDQPLFGVNTKN